jgi:hypothetical protein
LLRQQKQRPEVVVTWVVAAPVLVVAAATVLQAVQRVPLPSTRNP